jgi:hypothetical protein
MTAVNGLTTDRQELLRKVQELKADDDVRWAQIAVRTIDLRRNADAMPNSKILRELEQIEALRLGVTAPPPAASRTQQTFPAKEPEPQAAQRCFASQAPQESTDRETLIRRSRTADTEWQHIEDKKRRREQHEDQMYVEVRRAIRKLEPDYAKVMQLCLEDYTFEEIAKKTGIPKATAWRYYQKAVQTLAINVDPERLAQIATADYDANGRAGVVRAADELEAEKTEWQIEDMVPDAYRDREGDLLLEEEIHRARDGGRFTPRFRLKWEWEDTLHLRGVRQVAEPQQLSSSGADANPRDDEPKPVDAAGSAQSPEVLWLRERRIAKYGPYRGEEE